MRPPILSEVFTSVCNRGGGALRWGNPEPWVQTEVFAEFNRLAEQSGWIPFDTELPCVTHYPVRPPKLSNRDWQAMGAVKWTDLCMRSTDGSDWCWFELKVRHAGINERARKAALEAREVFRKDIVALLGFDTNATADIWEYPHDFTKAYWFESDLKPYAEKLRSGKHQFISAFLQLDGDWNEEIWHKEAVIEQVNSWKAHRCKQIGEEFCECKHLEVSSNPIGNHWLISVEWRI